MRILGSGLRRPTLHASTGMDGRCGDCPAAAGCITRWWTADISISPTTIVLKTAWPRPFPPSLGAPPVASFLHSSIYTPQLLVCRKKKKESNGDIGCLVTPPLQPHFMTRGTYRTQLLQTRIVCLFLWVSENCVLHSKSSPEQTAFNIF